MSKQSKILENEFIKEYSDEESIRIESNFQRLKNVHYLDHAGATQYADEQIQEIFSNLSSNLYSNPHTSKATEDLIDQVRYKILHSFNTTCDDYAVIFTSGATASLKIVAESFEFSNGSNTGCFIYLRNNHTSVLGMREIVKTKHIHCIEYDEFLNGEYNKCTNSGGNSLYVYPAQCNFNGFKYPLNAIDDICGSTTNKRHNDHSNRYVFLDAASFVSTNFLDLNKWRPDFVCVSFYKIFGYPSGLGALIVSRRGEKVLNKAYYGGGTVKISLSSGTGWHCKRDSIHERYEDGTIPFLSIISLLAGYKIIEKCVPDQTMERISRHCFNLAKYLFLKLKSLKYQNGRRVVKFYHDSDFTTKTEQGGIVTFNVLHEDGSYVGFTEVSNMAQLHNIYLRTGCFCNPGACQRHLKLKDDDLKAHFQAGHICGDDNDLIDGVPTGAIRISFGYMTTIENVNAIVNLIETCYCKKERINLYKSLVGPFTPENKLITKHESTYEMAKVRDIPNQLTKIKNSVKLLEICIYPIKSCAPLRVDHSWTINRRGLKYDREWMIVRSSGVALTQKSDPKLCLIQPEIDENNNTLSISFPYAQTIKIALCRENTDNKVSSSFCQSKVCGDRVDGIDCGDQVAEWLSDVLCTTGLRLIQQNADDKRTAQNDQAISLSNQAQFLLINVASVEWLTMKVHDWVEMDDCNEKMLQNTVDRFRANLIIESAVPLEEMEWMSIQIGNVKFSTTGPCTRCQMICIDQSTGEKTTEPLQTIAREFGGKMRFGIYLSQTNNDSRDFEKNISCNDAVTVWKQ